MHRLSLFVSVLLLTLFGSTGVSCAAQPRYAQTTQPVRVVFAGDSLMEKMGPQMQAFLSEHLPWSCLPVGKKSTGLCRPDFYNWPLVLEGHLREFRPHLVVMWVGTNDNQNVHGEKTGGLLTPAWKMAYYRKMQEIMKLCKKYDARLIFIGPPTVGDSKVDAELKQINQLMKKVCQHHNIPFLDVRPIFSDRQGRYIQNLVNQKGEPVAIRTMDQVHITDAGNYRVMRQLYPLMLEATGNNAPARRYSGVGISGAR